MTHRTSLLAAGRCADAIPHSRSGQTPSRSSVNDLAPARATRGMAAGASSLRGVRLASATGPCGFGSDITDRGSVAGSSKGRPSLEAIPKRRRRPSGEPPPLPASSAERQGPDRLTAFAFVTLAFIALVRESGNALGRAESELLVEIAGIRTLGSPT